MEEITVGLRAMLRDFLLSARIILQIPVIVVCVGAPIRSQPALTGNP